MQLTQQKEKYQNLLNEKEELQIQNESLKQNINILNNNLFSLFLLMELRCEFIQCNFVFIFIT